MTVTQIILTICSVIAIVAGIVILIRAYLLNRRTSQQATIPTVPTTQGQKSDLTIKINLPKSSRLVDDVASEALKKDLDLVVQNEEPSMSPHDLQSQPITGDDRNYQFMPSVDTVASTHDYNQPISDYYQESSSNMAMNAEPEFVGHDTEDTLSILANATESITPVVHTYDERKLKNQSSEATSKRLDSHIQSQIDQEQNNLLYNAEHNITITLIPAEPDAYIAGTDVLKLVNKYGMKYGAMKMFHRYKHQDGTGVLWFSMMMLSENGVESFDLNRLPTQSLRGLALFLPLPHPEVMDGFSSMISVSKNMAIDLKATIYDDKGQVLTNETIAEKEYFAKTYTK